MGARPQERKERKVKKLVILLAILMIVVSVTGCETAKRSNRRNMQYLGDDTARALGLDQPSQLHARDTEPIDLYEPHRSMP